MGEFGKSLDRKRRALEALLADADLSEPGVKNDLIASNETAWELGVFDGDEKPEMDDSRRDGFIVRARRDAYAAKLHASDTLLGLSRIERELSDQRKILLALIFLCCAVLFGRWW